MYRYSRYHGNYWNDYYFVKNLSELINIGYKIPSNKEKEVSDFFIEHCISTDCIDNRLILNINNWEFDRLFPSIKLDFNPNDKYKSILLENKIFNESKLLAEKISDNLNIDFDLIFNTVKKYPNWVNLDLYASRKENIFIFFLNLFKELNIFDDISAEKGYELYNTINDVIFELRENEYQ